MKDIFTVIVAALMMISSSIAQPPPTLAPIPQDSSKTKNEIIEVSVVKQSPIKPALPIAMKLHKLFPADTVARFITKYGKDSLIKLINKRISASEAYLLNNIYTQKENISLVELIMVVNHFNLTDLKSISLEQSYVKDHLYTMYDDINGDTSMIVGFLNSVKDMDINLTDSFVKNVSDQYAQIAILLFGDRIIKDSKSAHNVFNAMYNYGKLLNNNDKIHMYFKLSELYKKNKLVLNDSINYQTKLFNLLYPYNNLKSNFSDVKITPAVKAPPKDPMDALPLDLNPIYTDFITFSEKHDAIRMLAYALYADDINMKKYSDNLMYLLDAQQKDGSWSVAKKYNSYHQEVTSTIYALWALCEFREKLTKE